MESKKKLENKEFVSQHDVKELEYGVDDVPPVHIGLVYSFQQLIANVTGALSVTYVLHSVLCTQGRENAEVFFAELLSTSTFMMGVASLMQCTFGVRLPIVQGSAHIFILPVIAMMGTKQWRCPTPPNVYVNITETTTVYLDIDHDEPWKPRLREISGCLTVASLVQVILGCTGVIGFLMNYIGPITLCPTIILIPLGLFEAITAGAQHQWGIAILTVALVMLFSLIMSNIKIPLPTWRRKEGCVIDYYRVFKLYPHILAVAITWILSYILTTFNVFPDDPKKLGYMARTDVKLDAIHKTKWFFFPYPTQWGLPTFSIGLFFGLVGAILSSILKNVGDYYATAKASRLPPPPKHVVNRGIAIAGFANIISGLVGAAHATTTYSGTVGTIQITGVASRIVWQMMSVMLIICGVFGKFAAALTTIPDPIIGGLNIVALGLGIPAGLSTLQYANMNSSRNQFILAVAIMFGMMIPFWLLDHPGIINTGSESLNQLLEVVLTTGTFVGGVIAFTLDNIIPGTRKERGLIDILKHHQETGEIIDGELSSHTTYDLPLITSLLNQIKCCTYVPFLPSYKERKYDCSCKQSTEKAEGTSGKNDNGFIEDHSGPNFVSHL